MDGEFELIGRLRSLAEAGGAAGPGRAGRIVLGSGDDASVTVPAGATATSVDAVVDGVDFRLAETPPRSVGHKALAAALSDLAAMGAEAGEAYVILGVPPDLDEGSLLEVGAGLVALAAEAGVAIVGGDVTRSPVLWLGVTVVGHAPSPADLVARAGARPGDLLFVTGELGAAAAGLALLDSPAVAAAVDAEVANRLRRRQLEPRPRLAAGRALAGVSLASAMIDVSDGLGADAAHLADASAVRVEIDVERLPIAEGVREVAAAADLDPIDLAAAGGEDYELLASVPAERAGEAVRAVAETGLALTEIGAVAAGRGTLIRSRDGARREPRGFDQLRRPRARSARV
jgi:thiamine-monophosphate kinase